MPLITGTCFSIPLTINGPYSSHIHSELCRIVLLQDFQNILNIDIYQIASIKNRKNQRNKTKVNNAEIRQILMSSSMAKELDDREVALTEKCKNSKYLEVLAFLSVIVGASYWIMLYLKCCNKLGFFSLLGFIPFFLYLIKVWSICKENENSLIENIKDKSDKYSPFLGKQVSSIIQNMKTKMEEEQNGNAEDSHYGCCPFRASCPHCPKNLPQ